MKTISQRIFGGLPAAAETIFSTDSYVDRLHSPKSAERNRRRCGEMFIVEGLNIHRPVDWKAFLTNDENKKSFRHLLLEHWSSPSIMEESVRSPITFIEGGQAFKLPCHDGVTLVEHQPEICSSHEETDVRIIIYIKYIQTIYNVSYKNPSGSEQRTLTSSLYFSILPNRSRSTFLWIQERS